MTQICIFLAIPVKPQGFQSTVSIFSDDSTEEIIIPPEVTEPPNEDEPHSEDEFQPNGGRKRSKKDTRGKSKNRK